MLGLIKQMILLLMPLAVKDLMKGTHKLEVMCTNLPISVSNLVKRRTATQILIQVSILIADQLNFCNQQHCPQEMGTK